MVHVDDPVPGPGELLVDIHATALNRADLLQRRGLHPPPPGTTDILGLECAGVVSAVGPEVSTDWLGRRVMSLLSGGGYAEQVTVPERLAVPIEDMDFASAAAIPEAYLTASEALLEEAQLNPGETVLVHAAASGVGSAAVQLAAAFGARVAGTASGHKCDFVRGLGASTCVDYQTHSFEQVLRETYGERPIDVIIDFVGAAHWAQNQALLGERGRLVSIGVLGGSSVTLDLLGLLRRRQRILGLVMRSRSQTDKIAITQRFIRKVWPLFQSGRLRPVVDRIFALSDVRAAHEYMERNENLGKVVLSVRD